MTAVLSRPSFYSLFSTIGESISPAPDQTQVRTRESRPESWHSSTLTYTEKEQPIPRTRVLPSINETLPPRQNRRSREIPSLPEGEHDAAARSRIRHKAERRRSRSTRRRHDANPTQSLRSSRRRDPSVSSTSTQCSLPAQSPEILKQKNRRSAPPPISSTNLEILQTIKQKNRRSTPLPPRLPIIPASPAAPLFRDPWLEDIHRELTGINHAQPLVDGLISPKSKMPRPALLSAISAKSTASTYTTRLIVPRNRLDVSNVPMSASKHSWGVFIDERAPLLLHYLNVLRRPSTALTLHTPRPTATNFAQADNARQIESRGWTEDMRGTRTFDANGYWVAK